jgi:hypothetical protein
MNLHQFNKYKEQHALANPVKVLPDVNFESKLRSTNNGAILHSGGTISARKESDVSVELFLTRVFCSTIRISGWLTSIKKHL